MWQDGAHLVVREGVLGRVVQFVPAVWVGWIVEQFGLELGPRVRCGAALGAHTACQHIQQVQGAGDLPAAQIAYRSSAPDVGTQAAACVDDRLAGLDDLFDRYSALLGGELGRVLGILLEQQLDEALEGARLVRMRCIEPHLPVDPILHELAVVEAALEYHLRPGEEERRLGARPCRQPVVGHGRSVGQAWVDDDELGTIHHPLENPLRVRIEVVPSLKVRGGQQDDLRVGVVGRGAVVLVPQPVPEPRAGGADVRVAVVPVDAPCLQNPVRVALVTRSAHVVDDPVLGPCLQRGADLR